MNIQKKKDLRDVVYNKIEKFVDLIDLNFEPSALNARANTIDSLSKLYKILEEEIINEKRGNISGY